MPLPTYKLTCTKKRIIAKDTYEILFTKPQGFSFKPGQFVLLDVPLIEKPADIQTRAFSIASTPDEPDILLCVKLKPGGRASRWIAEILQEGTLVPMKGPFGNFLLDTATSKEYLFIATGAGIAPFRPQILAALHAGDTRRMDVVFGVRTEEDVFWVDEFEALSKQFPNFSLHITLSAPSPAWNGHRGRVQTLVPVVVQDFSNKCVYVCGNPDMTKDVKGMCLSQWGVSKQDLHVEGYI